MYVEINNGASEEKNIAEKKTSKRMTALTLAKVTVCVL